MARRSLTILHRLASSVCCALDATAAAALTRLLAKQLDSAPSPKVLTKFCLIRYVFSAL